MSLNLNLNFLDRLLGPVAWSVRLNQLLTVSDRQVNSTLGRPHASPVGPRAEPGLLRMLPASAGPQTPPVARLQAGKPNFRDRRRKIITPEL